MSEKLKVGIIGCGGIAEAKHLPSLAHQKSRVEMVAFCDLIPERAEKNAKQYGTPDARVYTDYRELVAEKDIDVVHVLTPNVAHCELTVAALEAGKHVMCEKPMAATTADARKMLDAQKKSGKLLTIGYQNRYRQDSQVLKKLCETGELGEIYYAKAQAIRRRGVPTWGVFPNKALQGGGPLIDIGTHSLDLTLWMMDNYEPYSVMGASFEKLGRLLKPGEQGNGFSSWDNEDYQVEDSAFGFVTMKNGAVIQVETSWALNILETGEAKTTLCGTRAGADMNDGLRINHILCDKQTITRPETATPSGVAFFEGAKVMNESDFECTVWLDAVQGKGSFW